MASHYFPVSPSFNLKERNKFHQKGRNGLKNTNVNAVFWIFITYFLLDEIICLHIGTAIVALVLCGAH